MLGTYSIPWFIFSSRSMYKQGCGVWTVDPNSGYILQIFGHLVSGSVRNGLIVIESFCYLAKIGETFENLETAR